MKSLAVLKDREFKLKMKVIWSFCAVWFIISTKKMCFVLGCSTQVRFKLYFLMNTCIYLLK